MNQVLADFITDEVADSFLAFAEKGTWLHHPDIRPYLGTENGDNPEQWNRECIKTGIVTALLSSPKLLSVLTTLDEYITAARTLALEVPGLSGVLGRESITVDGVVIPLTVVGSVPPYSLTTTDHQFSWSILAELVQKGKTP